MRRNFLMLQGPHGPFFDTLAQHLRVAGHSVQRIGFNQGDAHFWSDTAQYHPFVAAIETWPAFLDEFVTAQGITDIVVYGDTRPVHRTAADLAGRRDLVLHSFEEGYLRPYWITYERGGANGNSALMKLDLAQIAAMTTLSDAPAPAAPATWGALRSHTWLGALYHANVLFRNGKYPNFKGHRNETVFREWMLHCRRGLTIPWHSMQRHLGTARLFRTGMPYHVALLQLAHDANMRNHSRLTSMEDFIEVVITGFAKGARPHHRLVFKAHPLEDGRLPIRRLIARHAADAGVADRVHYLTGGKLGPLLDRARSAVTINSTAGQQALWRGLPLKTFGDAIYCKPEFVSDQSMAQFFASPKPPDLALYRLFRQFLLETSQVRGSYYTARGRRNATRVLVDMMLDPCDPYARAGDKKGTDSMNLRLHRA